ncbi:hypothetical protein RhiirA1_472138 [Rhizophagus irregularis]|uniref:Uncharacterized protein n=1 Tax=Rhizophagus irregularis TaxID=588596 RepID=A0A2N0R2Y7_9GLOM|nr:hypothetical protein RhiirA1_472138 [Rhizophagus irregularis]
MFRACICSLNSFSTRLDVHEFWNPISKVYLRISFSLVDGFHLAFLVRFLLDSWVLWIFAVFLRIFSGWASFFSNFYCMGDKLISPDLYFYRVGVNSGW